MMLERIDYIQFRGQPADWDLEGFALAPINLIVGRNATGKSRVINIIANLANRFFKGKMDFNHTGEFHVVLSRGDDVWDYSFQFDSSEIISEVLVFNGEAVLRRGKGGLGRINSIDEEGKAHRMRFAAESKKLSVAVKRDRLQHPFLEGLHEWADLLRHFQFGVEMKGKNVVIRLNKNDKSGAEDFDERDTSTLAPIFEIAVAAHGDRFIKSVIEDMTAMGYPITGIRAKRPDNIVTHTILAGEAIGAAVKEESLRVETDQVDMSAGMFRALSLLIQTTHYTMSGKSGCILIDDIGEGLDYERSCVLIDLIREKAKQSKFQLIMSTNNRFVTNRVPLEEWCVLERESGHVRVRNYANSAQAFERFKRTGLNNFDLLATNYLQGK